jgi:hypothetical protein
MSIFRTIPYAVLSGSLLVGGSAYAQSMYSIDQRQDYQQDRIERGIRDGQITRSEAYRLEQGERAIDRAQARARADGVVTQQERARIDRMVDREGRQIYQQSHDRQQAWDRGQSWGHTDGRYDGWRDNGGRHDGWGRDGGGQNHGWNRDRDGDRGNHNGWTRGEHNGWDGNRPPGIERRDARDDRRIHNGDGMQNRESRQIYADRHNGRTATGTPPTTPTRPTTGTQPNGGSHNWGNGGWRMQQAANTVPATPRQQAFNTAPRQQAANTAPAAPRPTMTRVSSPSGSGRNSGARH